MGLTDRRRGQRFPVELGEHLVDRLVQLGLQHLLDALLRLGSDTVLELGQLVAELRREQVDSGGGDLAQLDRHATGVLQQPPQADAGRLRGALDPGARGQERSEAFAAGEPQQLAVAAEDVDPAPHRPQRPRRHDEARPLAGGQRARSGQQVQRDGRGHRGRDADGHRVDDQAFGAPVPVVEAQGQEGRGSPPQHGGEERLRPAPSQAEQPERHRRGDDGDDHRDDDPQAASRPPKWRASS